MSAPGETSSPATVVIFGRDGCHLCDEALVALRRLQGELGFTIEERDITLDDDLHRAYLERIPVIALDGRELSDHFIDEGALRHALSERHDAGAPGVESGR